MRGESRLFAAEEHRLPACCSRQLAANSHFSPPPRIRQLPAPKAHSDEAGSLRRGVCSGMQTLRPRAVSRTHLFVCAAFLLAQATFAATGSQTQTVSGSDGATIAVTRFDNDINIEYRSPDLKDHCAVFLALNAHHDIGSAVLPFQKEREGSTVFLPFKADVFIAAKTDSTTQQNWKQWKWTEADRPDMVAKIENGAATFQISRDQVGQAKTLDCVVYAKDLSVNDGWGKIFGSSDPATISGTGDKYIAHFLQIDLTSTGNEFVKPESRLTGDKVRIYQLLVRLFGNTNERRKQNGTLAENGVGKFNDINDAAIASLQRLGFTHIWLTGVLQQATATDYSKFGQPADDPDLLKGLAGSPYAIKDYFDVCPDYAVRPEKRLEEFKALVARIHQHGMKAMMDFVPNHVARSYNSDVKPELNFGTKGNNGAGDNTSVFFSAGNNFFYLIPDQNGPPLHLPTVKNGTAVSPTCQTIAGLPQRQQCDGLFQGETKFGRVTGNNKASWTPGIDDWYETIKLNYGYDFTNPSSREYPNANTPDKPLPDTWQKMDQVLAYWQSFGIDGFRCDVAHMVPSEFWSWAFHRARERRPDAFFMGEAYPNDPVEVKPIDPVISKLAADKSRVMIGLLSAGFNAVYDDPTYRAIKKMYEQSGWANDIDNARPVDFVADNALRYAENHDEVRLASKSQWGGVGKKAGPAICAILYGLSRGPVMLYSGQEVGEPADGVEGFGANDSRTSIFDYWSMPEFVKWVDDHKFDGARLSDEQKALRDSYGRLLNLLNEPAFRDGDFIPLNALNRDNVKFGRLPNDHASGHWLYAFLRTDVVTKQTFLVVVNLNPSSSLTDVRVQLPPTVFLKTTSQSDIVVQDRLNPKPLVDLKSTIGLVRDSGIPIAEIPAMTACYLEMKTDHL